MEAGVAMGLVGPGSLTLSILKVTQAWKYAPKDSRDTHRKLLEHYNLYMAILEECLKSVQQVGEMNASKALVVAMERCYTISGDLTSQHEKLTGDGFKKHIAFVLASWNLLKEKQNEFQDSVTVVHSLVQRFVEQFACLRSHRLLNECR
jgi:hypothetical protein